MSATRRLEFIARTQLTGAAASVSFQNIPTDFRKLFLVCYVVKDANLGGIDIRFNNDTANNYINQKLKAIAATVTAARTAAQSWIDLTVDENVAANSVCLAVAEISKPVAGEVARVTARTAYDQNASGIAAAFAAGEWTNTTDLINRIDVFNDNVNFAAGTRIVLYGARD